MAEDEEESSGETGWCLRRLGESQERLLLPEGEEVSVGRGTCVTYQLVSTACPLMISRTHCIFRQNAHGRWMVTDNKSLNGVWVNQERLEPNKPCLLTKDCIIQLGVPLSSNDKPEFEYKLVQENLGQIQTFLIQPLPGKTKLPRSKRKLNCDDSEASGTEGTSTMSRSKVQRVSRDGEQSKSQKNKLSKLPTVKVSTEGPEVDSQSDYMAATQQQCAGTFHLSEMRQSMAELRSLNSQVQQKQRCMQKKMKKPQQGTSKDSQCLLNVQQELEDLQKQMCIKREEHLHKVNQLKRTLQNDQGKSSAWESKATEEEHLKEQLAQVLHENSLLMEDLNRSHQDFENIIQAKNKELQETQKEKERMAAQREEVLSHMNDVLDNELQCIICSENFIEAVTLNCAHSFCHFCITSWRKRKEECPICRQTITSQTRSLVLDNCIDRMVAKLSQEMKDRRLALILERKGERSRSGGDPHPHRE
ncbi:E3 ubiquitin-protein ligase RNF8 isoform X2 [Hyperolius riggenbachi]|uniref:E3 ubiquitin-protein ligase RNF8 isoform X2 n=1 Tax=Hyperolius riggenbachi TaxID=752182 RepID=UPI0035A2CB67